MSNLLQGKVAIVTGGVTGIGRAIALEYLRQGASVAVNHYPDSKSASQFKEMLKEAGEGAKLLDVPGDIAKPETSTSLVEKTVEKFGRLDILVSNAGVCQFNEFLRLRLLLLAITPYSLLTCHPASHQISSNPQSQSTSKEPSSPYKQQADKCQSRHQWAAP